MTPVYQKWPVDPHVYYSVFVCFAWIMLLEVYFWPKKSKITLRNGTDNDYWMMMIANMLLKFDDLMGDLAEEGVIHIVMVIVICWC